MRVAPFRSLDLSPHMKSKTYGLLGRYFSNLVTRPGLFFNTKKIITGLATKQTNPNIKACPIVIIILYLLLRHIRGAVIDHVGFVFRTSVGPEEKPDNTAKASG